MTKEAIVQAFAGALGTDDEKKVGDFLLMRMADGSLQISLDGAGGPLEKLSEQDANSLWNQLPQALQTSLTVVPKGWI